MAIVATDIKYYLSGGAANTNPAASLGGGISTTEVAPSTIFDTVASAESSAGDTEYRCVYVKNNHATLSLTTAKLWVQTNSTSAGSDIDVVLSDQGKNVAETQTVANENTAPTEVFANTAVSEVTGLAMGNLAPAEFYAIWIKRVIAAATPAAADGFTLRVKGDTAA